VLAIVEWRGTRLFLRGLDEVPPPLHLTDGMIECCLSTGKASMGETEPGAGSLLCQIVSMLVVSPDSPPVYTT